MSIGAEAIEPRHWPLPKAGEQEVKLEPDALAARLNATHIVIPAQAGIQGQVLVLALDSDPEWPGLSGRPVDHTGDG